MPSTIHTLLRRAIEHRWQVYATYDGHRRALCPHALGTKQGRRQCLFFQFGGTSERGGIVVPGARDNWRCLDIDKLDDVEVRVGPWFSADNHTRPSRCLDRIEIEVAPTTSASPPGR